jgi:hypothetical protein
MLVKELDSLVVAQEEKRLGVVVNFLVERETQEKIRKGGAKDEKAKEKAKEEIAKDKTVEEREAEEKAAKERAAKEKIAQEKADRACVKIKEFGDKLGLKVVPLATTADAKRFKVNDDAEVTVLLYYGKKVRFNHALAKGELNPKAVASIVEDAKKTLEQYTEEAKERERLRELERQKLKLKEKEKLAKAKTKAKEEPKPETKSDP